MQQGRGREKRRQDRGEFSFRVPAEFDRRIYLPHGIAALVSELREQGIPASVALDGTGLRASELEQPATQTSYRQLDTVMRNALRCARDPATALRAGQRLHFTAYGMYGYALLSSATHAEVREFVRRYHPIVGPLCELKYSVGATSVTCTFEPLHWPDPSEEIYRFVMELAFSAHLTFVRDLINFSLVFSRATFVHKEPAHAAAYEDLFGCRCFFSQQDNAYAFELPQVDGPIAFANARTHTMARKTCDELLNEISHGGALAAEVRRALVEQPGRYPTLDATAAKLGLQARVLRRKLAEEGTSYRDLLAVVRTRLAIEYLRKTRMKIDEIASRLGYSDPANFRHAFVRWTGKSPSDFRTMDTPDP